MSGPVNFPQVPIVDQSGNMDIQWKMWLLNPQYMTLNLTEGLGVASGGTGLSSGTPGAVIGFISPTVIQSSGTLDAGRLVLGGGAGAMPSTPVGLGSVSTVLHGNAFGNPSFGPVRISIDVSGLGAGVLPFLENPLPTSVVDFVAAPSSVTFNALLLDNALAMAGGLGVNGATPQTAYASGGAAPAGGTGTAAGGWDTAAHRDAAITLLNNIRSALVANGIMS